MVIWVIASHFFGIFKVKKQRKFEDSIMPIFHRLYIGKRPRARASLVIFDFLLKVISSSIILFIVVPLLIGLVFNYILFGKLPTVFGYLIDCPQFIWYFLNSKFREKLKNRLGWFSTNAIYSLRAQGKSFIFSDDVIDLWFTA